MIRRFLIRFFARRARRCAKQKDLPCTFPVWLILYALTELFGVAGGFRLILRMRKELRTCQNQKRKPSNVPNAKQKPN